MRKICLLLLCWCAAQCTFIFAQTEARFPLSGNPALAGAAASEAQRLGKTGFAGQPVTFPITEHFISSSPDTFFWTDNLVTTGQGVAVFNALNASGVVYQNNDSSQGVTDVLSGKSMNFTDVPDRCYLSFDYETGSTWTETDSLVVEALNAAGYWDVIWVSIPLAVTRRNITLPFPLGLTYGHAGFQLRISSHSRRHSSNTETFRLFSFVLALKGELPYYENVLWDTVHTYRNTWSKMQGSLRSGYGIGFGNLLGLDAFDERGAAYNNGFNDTIHSHSFDLSGLNAADSVSLRFYYRAVTNVPTDSLILQYKNNGGLWVDQVAFSAAQAQGWSIYSDNVNRSRFNHSDFQFRIIARSSSNVSDTLKWLLTGFNIGKKLSLPFIEDFASTTVYPDAAQWKDRLVFVNHTYPIAPPSINVATFDGLNRVGVPYGFGRGYCDTLTSYPIRLDRLTEADTNSIYLTFYVQPQGLGEPLTGGDSLMLFGRFSAASPDSFNLLWKGSPLSFRTDSFERISILLPKLYWHDEFQLRFINIGSRTGNLAHWHLDYIHLDRGRSPGDAPVDAAIRDYPSPMLKKYSSVPYSHFRANQALFLNDTQYMAVNNNSLQAYAINYGREVFDQDNNRVDTFGNVFNNFGASSSQVGGVKKNLAFASFSTDTSLIRARFYTRIGTATDDRGYRANDTVWQHTHLSNYYAYDDGTAEAGYGILESPGKVALAYQFSQPDSMYGISVYYNRGVSDVSHLDFQLKVWQSLDPEEELVSIPAKAVYYNARNGFHYVKFTEPVYVSGKIYIGWEQNQIFPLNVGLDVNHKVNYQYLPNPEMSYYVNGIWRPTAIPGALMMRPLVGKWLDPPPVGLHENKAGRMEITLYPNPSTGLVQIRAGNLQDCSVSVCDVSGKEVYRTHSPAGGIDLSGLVSGIYFVKVSNTKNGASAVSKLLIHH